jgi:hypothetical protein
VVLVVVCASAETEVIDACTLVVVAVLCSELVCDEDEIVDESVAADDVGA